MSFLLHNQTATNNNSKKLYPYNNDQHIEEKVKKELNFYQNYLQTKFDEKNQDHVNLFLSIYKNIFNKSLNHSEIYNCKDWTNIGFQNKNPITDLRSLNVLGIYIIEYHCQHYNTKIKLNFMKRSYPYACAAFSVIFFIVKELNFTNNSKNNNKLFNLLKKEYFHNHTNFLLEELFIILFNYFDSLWLKHNATYMEFNNIFEIFTKQVNLILEKEPANFSVFKYLLSDWL
ncbi:hypothetical protein ABK040_003568 [Willaertia magna]